MKTLPQVFERLAGIRRMLTGWVDRWHKLYILICCLACCRMAFVEGIAYVDATPAFVAEELRKGEDIHNLYFASCNAKWSDAPGWFVGPWIYPHIGYYRPITSLLFISENRLFGRNFTAYNRVSLGVHILNCLLLIGLVMSVLRNHPRLSPLLGVVAVKYFATPSSSFYSSVVHSIKWWPAQNDLLSLSFGISSLIALDHFLVKKSRIALPISIFLLACAIGTKEMGLIAGPMAMALIAQRKGRWKRDHFWLYAFYLLVPIGFWTLRKLMVPNPWGPSEISGLFSAKAISKALFYWFYDFYTLYRSQNWFPMSAGISIILVALVGNAKKIKLVICLPAAVIVTLICAQFSGSESNWALALMPNQQEQLLAFVIYHSAIILMWRYRQLEPGIFAILCYLVVFVPIFNYMGYHYLYWPNAILALTDVVFAACVWRLCSGIFDRLQLQYGSVATNVE